MTISLELVRGVPEHIRFYDNERALCGADCTGESARVVPDDRDPVADASLYLCAECARAWEARAGTVGREPTVLCTCDRVEDGTLWKCAEVVPANIARALKHPAADGLAPVCTDCYHWIREHPLNDVDTPVEEAQTWASLRCPRE